MALSENTQYWIGRLRADVAEVSGGDWPLLAEMRLAEVEAAYGQEDAARNTLACCLQRFPPLHPGSWSALIPRAAMLCDRLSESRLLEPEVQRGADWMASPEVMEFQGSLPERVHEISLQTGRSDIAARCVADLWPGRTANAILNECRLAGWARDGAALRRLLPEVREALRAAGSGPDHLWEPLGYWLARACIRAEEYAEAAELIVEHNFPNRATDELVIALSRSGNGTEYARMRDAWLNDRVEAFRNETSDHHWCSGAVRHAAETIRRLGDAAGYRQAVARFREATADWKPEKDWLGCVVKCDLAVLHANAEQAPLSAAEFDSARRLFEGKEPGVPTGRGSKSLMAAILSAAHRDVGATDLALKYARKSTDAGDRRMHVLSALILGGRVESADAELTKLSGPAERSIQIGDVLLVPFQVGSSSEFLLLPPE